MTEQRGITIAGIPVRVQPLFFVIIVALGLFYPWPWYPITWVLIATSSVLLHEFGHAIAFRAFGLRPSVTLNAVGGLTSAALDDPAAPPFTPVKSIVTSLAGPLAALVLFGLPAYLSARSQGFDPWLSLRFAPGSLETPAEVLLAQVVYINVGWSLLNLIPVLPLDGGNVTASLFELVAPRQGRRIANVVSIVCAVGAGWWALILGWIAAPLFAALFVGLNIAELAGSRHDDVDQELTDATAALVAFDASRSDRLATAALARGIGGERARWAFELRAWARLAMGDVPGAHLLIVGMPAGGGPTASLRGALALASGQTTEGVTTLSWSLMYDRDRHTQVLGAIAVAQAGQVDAVVDELSTCGAEGRAATDLLRQLLEQSGHRDDARHVAERLSAATPRPPGW